MTARLFALALFLCGCGDDPPFIRMITYSPNAGFVGQKMTVSGMFLYSDQDNDVSQWVIEVIDPNEMLELRSPPTPVMNASAGVTGNIDFTFDLVPNLHGTHKFNTWVIDLKGRESNHLEDNLLRIE